MPYDFQKTLDDFSEVAGNYSRGQTALSLADLADSRNLRDKRMEQDFTLKRDQATLDRQQKYLEKQDALTEKRRREDMVLKLRSKGIKLPSNPTDEQISDAVVEFDKKTKDELRADAQNDAQAELSAALGLKTVSENAYKEASDNFTQLLSSGASVEAKRAELKNLLNNPLTDSLSEKQLKSLNSAVTGGDPDKAVMDVVKQVADDYWIRKGRAREKARNLLAAYQTPLLATLDEQKGKLAVIAKQHLDALDENIHAATVGVYKVIGTKGVILGKDVIKDYLPDPADKDRAVLDAENQIVQTAQAAHKAKTLPDPSAVLAGAGIGKPVPTAQPYDPFTYKEGGITGAIGGVAGNIINKVGGGIGNVIGDVAENAGAFYGGVGGDISPARRMLFGPNNPDVPAPTSAELNQAKMNLPANSSPQSMSVLRDKLGALPDDMKQAIKEKAMQEYHQTEETFAEGDRLIKKADFTNPNTVKAVQSAWLIYQAVLKEKNGTAGQMPTTTTNSFPIVNSFPARAPVGMAQ